MSLLTEKLLNLIVSQNENAVKETRTTWADDANGNGENRKVKFIWSFSRRCERVHSSIAQRTSWVSSLHTPSNLLTIRRSLRQQRKICVSAGLSSSSSSSVDVNNSFIFPLSSFFDEKLLWEKSFSRTAAEEGSERLFLLILNICYNFHSCVYDMPSLSQSESRYMIGKKENSGENLMEIVKFF